MFLENIREVFSSFCVEETAHGIELTKVKSENFHVSCYMGLGLEMLRQQLLLTTRDHRTRSPDFIQMASVPNPGLTWMLSVAKNTN